jgi:hypothetical protein
VDLINTRLDRYERIRKFAVIWNDFLKSFAALQHYKRSR